MQQRTQRIFIPSPAPFAITYAPSPGCWGTKAGATRRVMRATTAATAAASALAALASTAVPATLTRSWTWGRHAPMAKMCVRLRTGAHASNFPGTQPWPGRFGEHRRCFHAARTVTTKHPSPPHAETQRPLPADALLLDEASMMDLPLAAALFNAIECAVGWEAMRSRAHTPAQVCPAWGSPSRIVLV